MIHSLLPDKHPELSALPVQAQVDRNAQIGGDQLEIVRVGNVDRFTQLLHLGETQRVADGHITQNFRACLDFDGLGSEHTRILAGYDA